jgi:hypothetical protein
LRVGCCLRQFGPDLSQFTGIEPIAPAVGTFNSPFGAEEMAMQFHIRAAWAIAFPHRVNLNNHIALNVQQTLPGGLVLSSTCFNSKVSNQIPPQPPSQTSTTRLPTCAILS